MENNPIYKNKQLTDLPNEEWIDVYGFDGIYSVSNLGRVKSERRYISNGKGERLVKEKILSQALCADGRVSVNLSFNNFRKTKHVSQIVWTSFNQSPIPDGKCIMHKNKMAHDNRLSNLDCVTISQSHSRNWQMGLLPHLEEIHQSLVGSKWNEKHGIYVNGVLTEKLCTKCFTHKSLNEFQELNRNVCKKCRAIQFGVKEHGKHEILKELRSAGLKKCRKCDTIKSINDFYKGTSKCKICIKNKTK